MRPRRTARRAGPPIGTNLGVPATLFDPFGGLHLGGGLRDALPEHPGRFAPLLGMLVAELEQTGHAIDFLHPRRPPVPPSKRRLYAAVGIAAGVLLFAWLAYGQLNRYLLASDLRALERRLEDRKKDADSAKKHAVAVGRIEEWRYSDLPWLDVLQKVSVEFPAAKEAMANAVTFVSKTAKPDQRGEIKGPRGEITVDALVDTPERITAVQKKIDEHYRASVSDEGADSQWPYYSRKFRLAVTIDRALPAAMAPKAEKK